MASEHFEISRTAGTGTQQVQVWPTGSGNYNNYDYYSQGTVTDGRSYKFFRVYQFGVPAITTSGSTTFPASGGTIAYQVYSHYPWYFHSKPWWLSIKDASGNTINEGSVQPALSVTNPYTTVYLTAIANTTTNSRSSSNFRLRHYLRGSAAEEVFVINVSQDGSEIEGSITTPSTTTIPCTGGTVYLDIVVPQGVPWHLGNINSNYGLHIYDPNGNEMQWWRDSQTGTGVSQRYSVVWPNYATGTQDHTCKPSLWMVDSSSGTGYRGVEATFTFVQSPCAAPSHTMSISGLTNGDTYQINFADRPSRTFTIPYTITQATSADTITIKYPDGDRSDISISGFPSTAIISQSGGTMTRIRNLGTGDINSEFYLTVGYNNGGVRFIDTWLADTYGDYIDTHKAGTIALRQDAFNPGSISGTSYGGGGTRYLSVGSGATVLDVPYSAYVGQLQIVVEYDYDTGIEVLTNKSTTKNVFSATGESEVYFNVGNTSLPIYDSFQLVLPENYKNNLNFIYIYLYSGEHTAATSEIYGQIRLQQGMSSGCSSGLTVTYVDNGTWSGTSVYLYGDNGHFDFVVKSDRDWFINRIPTATTSSQKWYINDQKVSSLKWPTASSRSMSAGTYYVSFYQSGLTTATTQMQLTSYKGSQQGWTVDAILSFQKTTPPSPTGLSIDPEVIEFQEAASAGQSPDNFYVTSNSPWTATTGSTFLEIYPKTGGTGVTTVHPYYYGSSSPTTKVSGDITFTNSSGDTLVVPAYKGRTPTIMGSSSDQEYTVNANAHSMSINFQTDFRTTELQFVTTTGYASTPISVSSTAGTYVPTGNATGYVGVLNTSTTEEGYLTIDIPANTTGSERKATIYTYYYPSTDSELHFSGPVVVIKQASS